MSATKALSSSRLKSLTVGGVAISSPSPAPAHQLPPVVHAIGGSIGSALAILAFYPLERIRVELQSTVGESDSGNSGGTGVCAESNTNITSAKIKEATIEPTSCSSETNNDEDRNGNQSEGKINEHLVKYSHLEESNEEPSSTLDSPAGSYEIVSSCLTSADVVSIGTSSFDDIASDDEETFSAGLVGQVQELVPTKTVSLTMNATSHSSGSHLDVERNNKFDKVTSDDKVSKRRGSNELYTRQPRSSHETILQCLLRLNLEKTLYKGASHMATTVVISNAIFFYALQATRRSLASLQHQRYQRRKNHINYNPLRFLPKSKMGKSLMSSSLAGAINVLLTNPLWVASLRIMESKVSKKDKKLQHKQNLWNVIDGIARNEGVSHLWNGTCTSLLLVSNPIIQHFIYEQLRLWLLESRGKQKGVRGSKYHSLKALSLSPVEAFLFGALAKTAATVATYPLQLAQVLLRLQSKKLESSHAVQGSSTNDGRKEISYEGTLDCLYQQFSAGGIMALFHGMNAKLLQTVLTSAFTFLTYEQTLLHVGRVYNALHSK